VFSVLTLTFGALAIAMIVLALVPLARTRAAAAGAGRLQTPDRVVVARAAEDLATIQSQAARDGWTDDAIGRALASMRLVAAAAIRQPVSQKVLANGADAPEGRLIVRHGTLRPSSVSVSSSITPDDLARARHGGGSSFSTTRLQQLEGLQNGMTALTAALYRKEPARDAASFDEAVRHAQSVAKDIAAERSWWNEQWARR